MAKTSNKGVVEKDKATSALKPKEPARVPKQRPATRTIVRWNDDLDRQLLLSIQSACNLAGIRIPWANVAELMGEKITEGAIVQHLAKLRHRLEGEGVTVPPPLRRGGAGIPRKASISKGKAEGPHSVMDEVHETELDTNLTGKITFKVEEADSGSTSMPEFEEAGNALTYDHAIGVGERFLQFPGIQKTFGNVRKWSTTDGMDRKPSKLVVLRIAPKLLKGILENMGVNVEESDSHFATKASMEDLESVGIEATGGLSDNADAHGEELVVEAGTDKQSLLQIGAQHCQETAQWVGANLEDFGGGANFAGDYSAYGELFGMPGTPLQDNSFLHLYGAAYSGVQQEQEHSAAVYLPTPMSGAFGMPQAPGSGSSYGNSFGWVEPPFLGNDFQNLENNFTLEIGDFISPEYLNHPQ
ncbi:hypothetical protein LOZ29_002419 [Ophidiomyces ophidiicola]|uniref:uncharacterized protein n=1 Tax=Ophidiomyces ophidiicola TaxID=1387563 RepID=UPI0020C33483|nr:uncharacterized protein LOZ57_000942 [Ophidiomyces ophidiicola]KAI1952859.1 hypothetical protein LOZ57_000942 [Ophidiomyces ophidiicola]KAI2009422.1 hypothetical protein LOZ49_003896 [Ophidiomyces ophidiicola]KAI2019089.1 hypothetical protein LOZ46_003463 [Ophidiomyces ophidiicola]KAI2062031.1 hypothetical protein LOZ43_000780 [Ophidiomyces ophidiicola]KAI2089945.1 hypothetical protein LOZ36_001623 [Ophidiomyces ophidiicola]